MQSKYKLFVYDNIIDMLGMHLWISVRQNSGTWPIVLRRPLSLKLSKS